MNNSPTGNFKPDPAVLNDLLTAASKKLGCTPEQLKKSLEGGSLPQNIGAGGGNSDQLSELKRVMNDPAAMQKLMNDPKAAALLKKLSGK